MIDLVNTTFDAEVLKSDIPVVVLWTSPSDLASTSLIQNILATEAASDHIKFGKVDIDAEPELASHYSIRELPFLMRFENELLVARSTTLDGVGVQ